MKKDTNILKKQNKSSIMILKGSKTKEQITLVTKH